MKHTFGFRIPRCHVRAGPFRSHVKCYPYKGTLSAYSVIRSDAQSPSVTKSNKVHLSEIKMHGPRNGPLYRPALNNNNCARVNRSWPCTPNAASNRRRQPPPRPSHQCLSHHVTQCSPDSLSQLHCIHTARQKPCDGTANHRRLGC